VSLLVSLISVGAFFYLDSNIKTKPMKKLLLLNLLLVLILSGSTNNESINNVSVELNSLQDFYTYIGKENNRAIDKILTYQFAIVDSRFGGNIDAYLEYFANGNSDVLSLDEFVNGDLVNTAISALNSTIYNELFRIQQPYLNYTQLPELAVKFDNVTVERIDLGENSNLIDEEEIAIIKRPQYFYLDEYIENPKSIKAWEEIKLPRYDSRLFEALSHLDTGLFEINNAVQAAGILGLPLMACGIKTLDFKEIGMKEVAAAIYITSCIVHFRAHYNGDNGFSTFGYLLGSNERGEISPNNCELSNSNVRMIEGYLKEPPRTIVNPKPTINPDYVGSFSSVETVPHDEGQSSSNVFNINLKVKKIIVDAHFSNEKLLGQTVFVNFVFDTNGQCVGIKLERGLSPELDEIILEEMRGIQSKFSFDFGATEKGFPVRFGHTIRINFD